MRSAVVAALLASGCSLATDVPVPAGASDDGRFALLAPSDLAGCGLVHQVVPEIGHIPALSSLASSSASSPAILLDIDPSAFRPLYRDRSAASLYHSKTAIDPDSLDTIPMQALRH